MSKFYLKLYFSLPGILKRFFLKFILLKENEMFSDILRQIFSKQYQIHIGYGTYGGCFNLKNDIPPHVTFGNYCSIAKNIRIFRANHPKNSFTSHPLLYNPIAGYVKKDMLERPALNIGNDVWIGEWVVILPNVTSIGNGAIIGAGSIVTKNVEPYSVVVGNPAKIISQRFDEDTIKQLEELRWWELKKEDLINNIERLNRIVNKD
ncbi:transferase [Solitalea longa]|uniref:Transferase n=1 Tax=Solitalea longa TaxID=2079460 RepID=A0A2S5AAF1_9SPHI|nr:CatB-related O-acetyltransferase [Solitalea longa]POY39249.1 transferase [Solitalea longa]